MIPETEFIEAADALTALLEAKQPTVQRRRDKLIAGPSRKIQKLMRDRFRAQRKAVLQSNALRSLHVTLNRTGGSEDRLPARNEAHRERSTEGRAALSHGGRSTVVREDDAGQSRSARGESGSDSGSEGHAVRRVTGSTDAPLTDAGRKQAHDLKERVGDIPVFTAPNSRSRETGRIVNPGAQDAEWLRPWGVGKYEGMTLDAARDSINRLITDTPDQSPGVSRYSGQEGDTFDAVSKRLIGGTLAQRAKMRRGERVLNITSGRAIHIIHAAALNGFQSIDTSELVHNSDFSKPGDLFWMSHNGNGLLRVEGEPWWMGSGQYFAQHGETDWNEGVHTSESLREAEDPDRATLEAEIASALSAHVYAEPVTAAEQTTFAGAIAKAIDAGSEAAGTMTSTAAGDTESFIAEYLKDGGFSRLTGDLDKTTVDRLASAVADAYEAGADFDGVVQAVKDSFADASTVRAKMIAQTELNDAFNQSVMHFGSQSGATTKTWVTDLTPCVICIANALGGSIPMDEDFESGDDAPPSHPSCNCSLIVGVV